MKPADDGKKFCFERPSKGPRGPERKGFLDGVCRGDAALRARLEALLQADESPEPWKIVPKETPPGEARSAWAMQFRPGGEACRQHPLAGSQRIWLPVPVLRLGRASIVCE